MDIDKLNWTNLQSQIFSLLCMKAGEKLTQREIALALDVSPTAVANSLHSLEKERIISVDKNRSMNLVFLNRDNRKAIDFKRVENLRLIYVSGLSVFLEDNFPGRVVILFGSFSKGEDTTKSDIDIAVIGGKEKEIKLEAYEKKLDKRINLNFYKSLKEIHSELKSNILSGILLSGVIEL